jgi:hypothetical protein
MPLFLLLRSSLRAPPALIIGMMLSPALEGIVAAVKVRRVVSSPLRLSLFAPLDLTRELLTHLLAMFDLAMGRKHGLTNATAWCLMLVMSDWCLNSKGHDLALEFN